MSKLSNTYLEAYKNMRRDISSAKAVRDINTSVPLNLYVEWDRLRMILNPQANLSPVQMKLGVIPKNWSERNIEKEALT